MGPDASPSAESASDVLGVSWNGFQRSGTSGSSRRRADGRQRRGRGKRRQGFGRLDFGAGAEAGRRVSEEDGTGVTRSVFRSTGSNMSAPMPTERPQPVKRMTIDELEELGQDNIRLVRAQISGRVRELSFDARGCHIVQLALDPIGEDGVVVELIKELQGHVCEVVKSPHANHVLQKAITMSWPSAVRFILEELKSFPDGLACHIYGCRVLERLLEHFPPKDLDCFVNQIMADLRRHMKDKYGNFVVQHLFEHGTDAHRDEIVSTMLKNISYFATHQQASGVLDKALTYATPAHQLALAEQMLAERDLLVSMCLGRGGFAPVVRLFRVLSSPDVIRARGQGLLESARHQIEEGETSIARCKHGHALIQALTNPPTQGGAKSSVTALPATFSTKNWQGAQRRRRATGPQSSEARNGEVSQGVDEKHVHTGDALHDIE